jgi:hypothetical protein
MALFGVQNVDGIPGANNSLIFLHLPRSSTYAAGLSWMLAVSRERGPVIVYDWQSPVWGGYRDGLVRSDWEMSGTGMG